MNSSKLDTYLKNLSSIIVPDEKILKEIIKIKKIFLETKKKKI